MTHQLLIITPENTLPAAAGPVVPALFAAAGEKASLRFIEFFTATIRNRNTRTAYLRAAVRFCAWCERHEFELAHISPVIVAAYIEQLGQAYSAPTVSY